MIKANLGLATTEELLNELKARMEGAYMSNGVPLMLYGTALEYNPAPNQLEIKWEKISEERAK